MVWEHKEQTLQQRIATHDLYAKYEINDWILAVLDPKPGENILDLGCGNGKQLIEYASIVGDKGSVYGMDISQDLLNEAETKVKASHLNNVTLVNDSADNTLMFDDHTFDAVSCCFSIYYYKDIQQTLSEIKRVLKPQGRLFVAAPTRNNIAEITTIIPPDMHYINRTESEIIPRITFNFNKTTIEVFRNPVTFPNMTAFMDYFNASGTFKTASQKEKDALKNIVKTVFDIRGEFTMTKEVYGIVGSYA